jgi:hypothetical protein
VGFVLLNLSIRFSQLSSYYKIIHADTRYCILYIWSVVLLLSESRAIINGLDVILHSVMLQIIYSTVYRVKRLIEEETVLCYEIFKNELVFEKYLSLLSPNNIYMYIYIL